MDKKFKTQLKNDYSNLLSKPQLDQMQKQYRSVPWKNLKHFMYFVWMGLSCKYKIKYFLQLQVSIPGFKSLEVIAL